jgi:hypothetical protein
MQGNAQNKGGPMRLYFANTFLVGILSGTAMLALLASKPVTAADDPVVQADRAVVNALEKGDRAAANKLLDSDFSWIDSEGVMWAKEDAFRAGLKPLVPSAGDVNITEHKYGKVVWIQENQANKYVAHFWVQRPQGWRLLHTNEINVNPAAAVHEVRPDFDVPCVNPCQQMPYKPESANEKAAIEGWLDQEAGTGNHDAHLGENLRAVHSEAGVQPPKAERVAATQRAKQDPANRHRPSVGVAPVLWARTWDFGDTVVAVMLQPTWGGKAYWASRIFANHNGFWMMEESYHTTIQSAPIMTAVPMGVITSKGAAAHQE